MARAFLGHALKGVLPSEQEKVVATKRATVRLQEPVKNFLHGVSYAHTPKLDGSTVWAVRGELICDSAHDSNRRLSPCWQWRGHRDCGPKVWSNVLEDRCSGRRRRGPPPGPR